MKAQNDIMIKLLMAKTITLRNAGLTSDECLNISEYEFTVKNGVATELEVWSNTKRTKGHKVYNVPKNISKIFEGLVD